MARDRGELDAEPMPPELEGFYLWCIVVGAVDEANHCYTGDRAVWKAERARWLAGHGRPADVLAAR